MRKAKIALSAIAIFAVIGGAFAFKAARQPNTFYTIDASNGICSLPVTLTYTTNLQLGTGAPFTTRLATTKLTTTQCPVITVRLTN